MVTREELGAWLVKANPRLTDVAALAADDFAGVATWCVRPSYRTRLVAAGDRVLLWVSGGSPLTSGIHAHGVVTGPVTDSDRGEVIPLRLWPSPLVARDRLRADPVLAGLEVLRSPWGSNPSYLTRAEADALEELAART